MKLPKIEWQLNDYLRILWFHKWLVIFMCLVFGSMAAFKASQEPNIYQATARIILESDFPDVVRFRDNRMYGGRTEQLFLLTEYRVITSRAVASRVVDDLHLAAFPPFSTAKDPIQTLQGMVSVQPVRGTKLVDITTTGTKPELVARISNSVADSYAQLNLERRREMTTGGMQWLQNEVVKLEEKVRTSSLALQKFREEHGSVEIGEDQQNSALQRLQSLNAAVTETREKRIEAETRYRDKHPQLLELMAKEKELQRALFDQEKRVLDMNRLGVQYSSLLREAKTTEGIYNVLLTRLKELTVEEGVQSNNVQVVDYALIPDYPIGPARQKTTASGVLLGFIIGGGLAFLRELMTRTIRTRSEFEQLLEIPFLGHIPIITTNRPHHEGKTLVVRAGPKSTASEAFRSIRTTVEFLLPPEGTHTILVTSSLPEEGKSFVTLNLAVALQELGRKVVLLDCDLRRPSVHRSLQMDLEPGLSGYLQGNIGEEEVLRRAPLANDLTIATAGITPQQPTDLLSSPRFQQLLHYLKERYQYIFIDTPPVLVSADAAALATIVTGIVFLVRAGVTHSEAALAGKQRLADVGGKIIGGILNGARLELEGSYRYYHYYYYNTEGKSSRKPHRPPRESA